MALDTTRVVISTTIQQSSNSGILSLSTEKKQISIKKFKKFIPKMD